MTKYLLSAALILAAASPVLANEVEGTVDFKVQSGSSVSDVSHDQTFYTERVSPRVFSVTVDGDKNDSREEVIEKALYKAAKKTLKYDYDWFRVVETDVERERVRKARSGGFEGGFETRPVRQCGLLGCSTTHRTSYRADVSSDRFERSRVYYSAVMEFEMGTGRVQKPGEIYDARHAKREFK